MSEAAGKTEVNFSKISIYRISPSDISFENFFFVFNIISLYQQKIKNVNVIKNLFLY